MIKGMGDPSSRFLNLFLIFKSCLGRDQEGNKHLISLA